MKATCPSCQFENPKDAKFCLECGQRMKRSADPLIGQQLGNHRLVERIGVGGMGVIYLAEHVNLGKTYAIKFLHPQFASDEEVVERFRREAQVISSLDHPNIVRETDFGWLDGVGFYLVMEFLQGETLKEVIKREGALDPHRVKRIYNQLLDALDVAHEEGVVHRDLKPENLFLIQRRSKEILKILDFGIARIAYDTENREEFTVDGEVYGSPTYMSPEQARGDIARVDPRSDLYSVGVILVEALTGRPPYQGHTPAEVMLAHISTLAPRISDLRPELLFAPELDDVVIKSLAKESEDRFQSAHEFMDALTLALDRTIALRERAESAPATPSIDAGEITGKMEGHSPPTWHDTAEGPALPAGTPAPPTGGSFPGGAGSWGHSIAGGQGGVVSHPGTPPPSSAPLASQEWSYGPGQGHPVNPANPSSSFAGAAPVGQGPVHTPPPSNTPTPSVSPSALSGASGQAHLDSHKNLPAVSPAGPLVGTFHPHSSIAGQPSPYVETTPKPLAVHPSQLSSGEFAASGTPARSLPPHTTGPPGVSGEQPLPAALSPNWSDAPDPSELTEPSYDPNSDTSTMPVLRENPSLLKRPLLWGVVLVALVAIGFGLFQIFSPPEDPGHSPASTTDAGLPPLPQVQAKKRRRTRPRRPRWRMRVVPRRPAARPKARRGTDSVVKYQPPPTPSPVRRETNPTQDPPAPRKPNKAYRLHIESEPSGAKIFLAGQGKVANTPYTLQFPSGSRVTLHIRKAGYLPQSIEWRAEKHNRVTIQLIPDPSL